MRGMSIESTREAITRYVTSNHSDLSMMAPDVIFFLTDADEPRMTAKQLARVVQLNQGTAINAIEFGYGTPFDPEGFLVKLARQNNGKHVYVDISRLPARRR